MLRRNRLDGKLLVSFYRYTIESVLASCITVWFVGCSVADGKKLQMVIRTAEKTIGCSLPSLDTIANSRCLSRTKNI